MLSTVCALLILFFSGIELLKQIAIFTSAGLITVYLFVILFYQLLPQQVSREKFDLKFNRRLLIIIFLIIFAGVFKIHFDDDIRSMYKPSNEMLQAEKLYQEVTDKNSNTSFVIIEGEDLQDILNKEEKISEKLSNNNISYQALSKFLPSKTRQKESIILQKNLYEKKLNDFKDFLTKKDIETLKILHVEFLNEDILQKIPQLKDFIIDENHTIMIVYDMQNPLLLDSFDGVRYINLPVEISAKIKNIRISVLKILLPIFLLLYLILGGIFTFKNAHKIILPSIIASLFAISFISIFQPLNLFHVLAIFLIIGFGLERGYDCLDVALRSFDIEITDLRERNEFFGGPKQAYYVRHEVAYIVQRDVFRVVETVVVREVFHVALLEDHELFHDAVFNYFASVVVRVHVCHEACQTIGEER